MSPDEAASKFVSEYLPRYDRMSAMLEQCDPGKVIDLWFEDIFFDFDKALDRMESFVGLSNRPSDFDNLDFSAASRKVKMYNKGEFSKEVALIEGDMRRHLYSY